MAGEHVFRTAGERKTQWDAGQSSTGSKLCYSQLHSQLLCLCKLSISVYVALDMATVCCYSRRGGSCEMAGVVICELVQCYCRAECSRVAAVTVHRLFAQ